MKAIITVDVPEHQIGQEVSVYFKDTMCVKSVCTPLTEPDDCVSREAVLDIFGDIHPLDYNTNAYVSQIKKLPSVQPKKKSGKWIPDHGNVKCSVCGHIADARSIGAATHYCSFCGAEMKGGKE